ncbi:MAG: prepilin-type N-terminal cleavage/methylation domain-containing protein [Syntrophobacteraceae bacterium]
MRFRSNGFTLVELLVVLALTGLVTLGAFRTFMWQQGTYTAQENVATLQQDIRGGLDLMIREIRMAGYSPKIAGVAGITAATANSVTFTVDLDSSGAIIPAETVTYLVAGNALQRQVQGINQPVIDNVDCLDFVYLNSSGVALAFPIAAADLPKIKTIQITVVARAGRQDKGFINSTQYRRQPAPGSALGTQGSIIYTAPGDSFKRRALSVTVNCRNLG